MTGTYKGVQNLSATARQIGFAVSTVNSITTDAAHIKEHANRTFHFKHLNG
jgi:hypothetical protein